MIEMNKEGLFSGKLLLNDSGLLLDAGHSVYPSPDGKRFLAIRQEDGMDGELWLVSDLTGTELWSGYAGVTAMVKSSASTVAAYETVEATYEDPHWSRDGVLQARVVCNDSRGVKKRRGISDQRCQIVALKVWWAVQGLRSNNFYFRPGAERGQVGVASIQWTPDR